MSHVYIQLFITFTPANETITVNVGDCRLIINVSTTMAKPAKDAEILWANQMEAA